jgi:hypothetical protein
MLLSGLAFLPARFDDPTHTQTHSPFPQPTPSGVEEVHQEMRRVFRSVERELREVDQLLAKAGDRPTGPDEKNGGGAAANAAKLLSASEDKSKSVISGIDRILELAKHPHPPGSGGT